MKYQIIVEIDADNMGDAMAKAWSIIGGTSGIEYAIVRKDNDKKEEEKAK